MTMMKYTLAALALLMVGGETGGSPALAADIDQRSDPNYAHPAIGRVNWTGIYVGGQVGYQNNSHNLSMEEQEYVEDGCSGAAAQANGSCKQVEREFGGESGKDFCERPDGSTYSDSNDTCDVGDTYKEIAANETYCSGGGAVDPANPNQCGSATQLFSAKSLGETFVNGLSSSGGFAGGTIGADYQRGNFLVGAFFDYNFGSGTNNVGITSADPALGVNLVTVETGESWVAAARGGILIGEERRALLYGLIGYGQQNYSYEILGGRDVTHSGLVVGAGGEYALTDTIFLGIEWQHFFGNEEAVASYGGEVEGEGSRPSNKTIVKDDVEADRVMAKLKIKLNGGLLD